MEWIRETPGAESYGPEAWRVEAQRCAGDGIEPPSFSEWMDDSRDAGWSPFDPLHVELLHYERLRGDLGDAAMDSASGPPIEWSLAWGAWTLAEHRAEIAKHWRELGEIRAAERRGGA